MKKIEFANLQMAVDHAKKFGGWIFYDKKENITIWYDAVYYTMTMILNDAPGSGVINTWSHFEKRNQSNDQWETNENNYIQPMNKFDKKIMKKVNDIVEYASITGNNITKEMTVERLYSMINQFGEEKAFNALENTLKKFKQAAKKKENEMWSKVRLEIFNKNGSAPSSIRNLKTMLKNGEIDFNGIESQKWLEKELGIQKSA